jgi:hypothetical protein
MIASLTTSSNGYTIINSIGYDCFGSSMICIATHDDRRVHQHHAIIAIINYMLLSSTNIISNGIISINTINIII